MKEHAEINWPAAPQWALSLGEGGRIAVALAAAMFVVSAISWLLARNESKKNFARVGIWSFWAGSLSILGAFSALAALFLYQQYEFKYVYDHSDNWLQPGMRFASIWGGQEGSFLLWATTTAIFGLIVGPRTEHYRRWFTAVYAVFLACLAGILAFESPFHLLPFKGAVVLPPDGAGMNPVLANYWMQIHPPTIFAGFGSLTVIYAFAIAALATGDLARWTKLVRPWAILSLGLLGIGLCMGGFWAYETLGWGGFWAWDPVENASLIPWLAMAAFVHTLMVQNTRKTYPIWTAVAGGIGMTSFAYGTFLTRSGFLSDVSVHSFAEMNSGSRQIMIWVQIIFIGLLSGLAFYRHRKMSREKPIPFETISKLNLTNGYLWATILLLALAAASIAGMSVPFVMALMGKGAKAVEESTYNQVASYFFIPIMILMGSAPFWGWRGHPARKTLERTLNCGAISLGILGFGVLAFRFFPAHAQPDGTAYTTFFKFNDGSKGIPTHIWIPIISFFCLFALIGTTWKLAENWKSHKSTFGGYLTHIGVIVTMLGLIVSKGLQRKEQFTLQGDTPTVAMGYAATIQDLGGFLSGLTKRENTIKLSFDSGQDRFTASPTLYYIDRGDGKPSPLNRPHVVSRPLYDLYVVAHDIQAEATEPTSMAPGELKVFEGWSLKFLALETIGKPGQPGTRFRAKIEVTSPDGKVQTVRPTIMLTPNGMDQVPDEFGGYFIYMDSMDPGTKAVSVQLFYKEPLIPIELYFKPLTGLVWWGAGIMIAGAFLAAFQRRIAKTSAQPAPPEAAPQEEPETAATTA